MLSRLLADGEGFEPSRRLHVCRFSRPVPSTTRPPIHSQMLRIKDGNARIMGLSLDPPTILHKAMSRKPDPYGRDATRPHRIPLKGWWQVAQRVWTESAHDNLSVVAAGC